MTVPFDRLVDLVLGRPVSDRVLVAEFPPEPEGRAVAIDSSGFAYQRDPGQPGRAVIGPQWFPLPAGDRFTGRAMTWRELHAGGPVVVAWDPAGVDRIHAQALASYSTEATP